MPVGGLLRLAPSGPPITANSQGQLLQWDDSSELWTVVGGGANIGDVLTFDGINWNPLAHQDTAFLPNFAKFFHDQTEGTGIVVTNVTSQWFNLFSDPNQYVATLVGGNFTFNTTTCRLTYTGLATAWFGISLAITIQPAAVVVSPVRMEVSIDHNAAIVGTSADPDDESAAEQPNAGQETVLTFFTAKQLATNDTLDPVVRNDSGTESLTVSRLSCRVFALEQAA